MNLQEFQADIRAGIPDTLPAPKPYDPTINHAPKRKEILSEEEKVLALKNALRTYPESDYREEIMYLIVDSSYRLAENSIASKQTDRYLAMLDSYLSFCEEFPESKHRKQVDRWAANARDYLARNAENENVEEL